MRDSTDINDGSNRCKSSQDFHVWTYIKPTLKLVATIRTQRVVAAKVTSESICSYQFLKQLMVVKGKCSLVSYSKGKDCPTRQLLLSKLSDTTVRADISRLSVPYETLR